MRDIRTTVMGNVASDVKEITHPDGEKSAIIRLAVTSRYYDQSAGGYADRKTEFISVYARRSLARNALASITKGQPLIVTGRIGSQEWTDQHGNPRHTFTIQAEALGHDLSFGHSRFTKPLRFDDVPDVDERTGEVIEMRSGQLEEDDVVDDLAERGDLVGAGEPAF